jgi:hypothetical protein
MWYIAILYLFILRSNEARAAPRAKALRPPGGKHGKPEGGDLGGGVSQSGTATSSVKQCCHSQILF